MTSQGYGDCPECGGDCQPRRSLPGFMACEDCGKLIVAPKANDVELDQAANPLLAVAIGDDEIVVPDQVGVKYGWRTWHLDGDGLLNSVSADAVWTPYEPMRAQCDKAGGHEVPGVNCTCGLYAAKTLKHLRRMRYIKGESIVLGRVSLWGGVVEGTQGWRAEFGYPAELYVPHLEWRNLSVVAERYGVPATLADPHTTNLED